jgi:transposase-like protein
MTTKKYKRYTKEFKLEALRMMRESDRPASEIAMELGIRRNQLYKWAEQFEAKAEAEAAFKGAGSNGVRVKGQSKNRMEVSPRNIRFKSFANRFAILLQTRLPQSRRLTGCIASAIDALHYT